MNKTNLILCLLAVGASAEQLGCAPESAWATGSHFSAEIAGGAATMGGSPYSTTTLPAVTEEWTFGIKQNGYKGAGTAGSGAQIIMQAATPGGYKANWHQMSPSANRLGFAGQLNLHYMAVEGHFAGGIYGGVGYNGAHSSSTTPQNFDNLVTQTQIDLQPLVTNADRELAAGTYGMTTNKPTKADGTVENSIPITHPLVEAHPDRSAKNASMPPAKATVSSGLMFQAGARLGAMIGNVFPHLRVGWATYQLKAHMTNQYAARTVTGTVDGVGGWKGAGEGGADGSISAAGVVTAATSGVGGPGVYCAIGSTQNFADIDSLYNMGQPMKISSKGSKWTNAATVGGGVDWAFQKMTVGFYYQAAICQRVTFDKWNNDVTGGLAGKLFDLTGKAAVNAPWNAPTELDGRKNTMTYAKNTPKVSISPVIHTVMASIKVVISKA